MTVETYPEGLDCVWVASDKLGRVAAFITAGVGPIPKRVLNAKLSIEDVESELLRLAERGSSILMTSVPRPDDFVELANRGLFVFDWTDVYRTTAQEMGAYELVATPTSPAMVNSLPIELGDLAKLVQLNVRFDGERQLIINSMTDCLGSGS